MLTKTPPILIPQAFHQYKTDYPETFLFFEWEGGYACFHEDAANIARLLGVPLGEGVNVFVLPQAAIESTLKRLISGGHKVAVCERKK